MVRYLVRRIALVLVMLLGVSMLVFFISNMVPSDPVAANLSQSAMSDPELVEAFKEKWGLDKPVYEQYFIYLKNLLQGDMGTSIRTGQPVMQDLMRYYPATVELSLLAILIAVVFGILFGIFSAVFRDKPIDQILRGISVSGVSIPSFWFSLLMLYIFFYNLGWFPGPGRLSARTPVPSGGSGFYILDGILSGNMTLLSDALSHIILPALVLGFFTMGLITRQTRSNLLETMSSDYIRTARSKGLGEYRVVSRHALGNALIPVITVAGMGFCNLLGGMVFVEKIFAWPGIGQYAYLSATTLDFPAICGVSLLIAFNYVIINLIIDILYGAIDPRIRHQ